MLYVPRTVAPQVGARLTWEETGLPGTLLAGFFVVYLCADTLIACLMRSHLQRSLGPLYIHHTIVVVGVVCHTSISNPNPNPKPQPEPEPEPSPSPNRSRTLTPNPNPNPYQVCYMFPSPPRALFMYMWGEALTACRILPAGPYRWRARSLVV